MAHTEMPVVHGSLPGIKRVLRCLQGSHGIEKPGKSREFVLVFFPGLEVWNFVENPGNLA